MRPEAFPAGAMRGRAMLLVERRLDPGIAAALDAAPAENLPDIRMAGPVTGLHREILARLGALPDDLADWLAGDVAALGHAFGRLAGATRVAVRLEGVAGDACSLFHVDAVRLRLVSTYRGPGTQYLPEGWAGTPGPDGLPPSGDVRHMARGDYAVIRGSKAGKAGLVHRSPPVAGTGTTRLFLSVDEA